VPANDTVTSVLFQPLAFAPGLALAVVVGGVLSMLMPEAVAGALTLSALSVQAPEADWPAPSVVSNVGEVQLASPESASLPLNVTVTSVLFQPLAFAPGLALALAVGAVLSMLMPEAVAGSLTLPALSVQVPEADWPAPSAARTAGAVQLAIPESASLPVNVTVTSVLFQPLAFAPGLALALAVGGVLSMLTECDAAGLMLSALSVQVPDAS